MSNRFYTVLIVPEKTSQVRRVVVPAWILKGSLIGIFFALVLGFIMILDYWYVMGQIGENKQLCLCDCRHAVLVLLSFLSDVGAATHVELHLLILAPPAAWASILR